MTALAPAEYDLEAAALLDDGYTEEEVVEALGERPTQSAVTEAAIERLFPTARPVPPLEAVEAPVSKPKPRVVQPSLGWLDERQEAAREAREPLAAIAKATARSHKELDNGRPAPGLSRVQLSWDGKVERIAQAMAYLRGLHWSALDSKSQEGFFALAEFALRAVEKVEQQEVALKHREPVKV